MAEFAGVVASHTNSEHERLTIERTNAAGFEGQLLLVIHDDPPFSVKAPMLLDEGTQRFLRSFLADGRAETIVDAIIADLSGRKGLGDEWDVIDDEIRAEIRAEWIGLASS